MWHASPGKDGFEFEFFQQMDDLPADEVLLSLNARGIKTDSN